MSNKRPLTAEEKAMADRMKAIFESNPSLTQEAVGVAAGVTQGTVWQWIEGRLPVSAKRAAALAQALGIEDPREISVAYRDIGGPGEALPAYDKESHAPRFDLDSIVDAAWALAEAFAAKIWMRRPLAARR